MLTPRPQLTEEELFEPAACAAGTRAVEAVLQKDREAALLQAEQGKLTAQKAALAPWLSLDLPLESGSTREMLVQFGTLTAARPLEEAQRTVEEASELAQLIDQGAAALLSQPPARERAAGSNLLRRAALSRKPAFPPGIFHHFPI